ncbi:MAG: hypothetical protein K2K70_02145 [Lachnospiraceae bacterium]|nr:hypothetical protein [Lachnospiraceae bacterium]
MRKTRKIYLLFTLLFMVALVVLLAGKFLGVSSQDAGNTSQNTSVRDTRGTEPETADSQKTAEADKQSEEQRENWINASGNTLETRILPPEGFARQSVKEDSLTAFLRTYPMKKDGSDVRLFNGKRKDGKMFMPRYLNYQ